MGCRPVAVVIMHVHEYEIMEAERAPEMLVQFYQDTRCHDPEESSLTYRYTSEGAFS